MNASDDIQHLLHLVREAEQSEKNVHNLSLWGESAGTLPHLRGLPQKGSALPITVEPEAPMWTDILGFDLARYYTEPSEYLRRTLEMDLYRFTHWEENTCIRRHIGIWLGVSFEASLFGAETVYREKQCPWIPAKPVITCQEDLERLETPDFRSSGLMPQAHRMYEGIRRLLPKDFEVEFPDWQRSPFGVCTHLRGTEDLLMDMIEAPDFFRAQLRFVTACRKKWRQDRAAFLERQIEPGDLLNDEVNGQLFPPRLYEELILPGEIVLGRSDGVRYWHSCADVTAFLPLIRKIPGLRLFHVGPWTDVTRAAEEMGDIALQICLDPLRDVQRASDAHIEQRLDGVCRACHGKAFTIRVDGLHTIDTLERELEAIEHLLDLARRVGARWTS